MKPPSNVKTPTQYIASLPADRAKTIATVRALVNKHIPRGYDECIVWGTIGWTIPLSRYPDTYNKQAICYVALSSQKNYCSLYLTATASTLSALYGRPAARYSSYHRSQNQGDHERGNTGDERPNQ